jgi:hypothetical protein
MIRKFRWISNINISFIEYRQIWYRYSISDHDQVSARTLSRIAMVVAMVSLAACYWPARRATAIGPMSALHDELSGHRAPMQHLEQFVTYL